MVELNPSPRVVTYVVHTVPMRGLSDAHNQKSDIKAGNKIKCTKQ
jgi:hypothetical protein